MGFNLIIQDDNKKVIAIAPKLYGYVKNYDCLKSINFLKEKNVDLLYDYGCYELSYKIDNISTYINDFNDEDKLTFIQLYYADIFDMVEDDFDKLAIYYEIVNIIKTLKNIKFNIEWY